MTLSQGSTKLLQHVPGVLPGVGVRVMRPDGDEVAQYGPDAPAGGSEHRCATADAEIIASLPPGNDAASDLVLSLLQLVEERERLESDMESMNASSLRLLEQVSMLTETLPRLSAGEDDRDIASLGVRACLVAAATERVMFLAGTPEEATFEVLVDHATAGARAADEAFDTIVPNEGLLADILAVEEGVILRTIPEGATVGAAGSPESLAKRQILGVPVTYGSGDKRVVLGALLLFDKAATSYSSDAELGSEEGQVAESFAAMLGAVLGARKTAALGKELSMAQTIQRQILPKNVLEIGGFDVAADYQACGAVGGDYFDYVRLADGRTMVVVADVSGHNLASGMMMVSARATLRTLASVRDGVAPVFDDFAAAMYEDLTSTERFITAAAVGLRENERSVEYVSAGHNDLFIYRAALNRVEAVPTEHTIVGFLERPGYTSSSIALEPGDCLLIYTDGITEATDETEEMFGEERLTEALAAAARSGTAREIVDAIVAEVHKFRGGEIVGDDVTAVVVGCTAGGAD
ncbi:MAG: PP2C family protein-serine/threonine phosphatase [bacterium]|nr:PP2C family protein-serine/threonine phosphatase [bacterium]